MDFPLIDFLDEDACHSKLVALLHETPRWERLVVLGDINEWLPLSRPLRSLHRLLGHSPFERTFPSRWPLFALDRVWVRPRRALLAVEAYRLIRRTPDVSCAKLNHHTNRRCIFRCGYAAGHCHGDS